MDWVSRIARRFTVAQIVIIAFVVMIAIAAVNVGAVYYYQSQSETLGNSVDVAGEQRMLTQRMARLTNRIAAGDTSEETYDQLAAAMDRYDSNLRALREGGEVDGRAVDPAPPSVQDQLDSQQSEWEQYRAHVGTVLESEPGSEEFATAQQYVQENSDPLLATSDETVQALAGISADRSTTMQQFLAGLFVVNLVVFVVSGLLTRRYVGTALSEVSGALTTIGEGSLDTDIDEDIREMGEVADERTRNEIISLVDATENMESYLDTVVRQATALADQDFEADVLDETVPGEFGAALDEMHTDLETLITEIEQAKTDAEASQAEAEALADALERKATEFSAVMAAAADGDLTRRMDTDSESEAMTEIAESYNEMAAELGEMVRRIREFATAVHESSQDITTSTAEVENASQEVSRSVQTIADGAERQNEHIRQVSGEMTDLSATIEEVASSTDEIAEKSQHAAAIGADGKEYAAEAATEMDTIERRAEQTLSEIESLEQEMGEIGDIVTVIDDIAEQTNILALNASIEAARAGEAGEGFAVVADEIKGLAEETREATHDIEEIITEVQASTDEVGTDMREMGESVTTGIETVEDTIDALERIVSRVEETNASIQSITEATDEQAASTEEVVAMLDEVGTISEQTSGDADDVAAAAEEQTSSITEVSHSVETLSDRAAELRDLLSGFEVDDAESSRTDSARPSTATDD